MDIVGKVEDAREDLKLKRLKSKLEDAKGEATRLSDENRVLHEQLDRRPSARSHPIRRLVWITIGAGCAYLMGAKAGRGRYEQARRWAGQARDRVTGASPSADNAVRAVTDVGTAVADGVVEVGEAGKDAVSRSKKAVETATERVGEAARQATADADQPSKS